MNPGTVLDNRYEILRPLGAGGMGTVFLARDLERRREVALKLLSDSEEGTVSPHVRREFEALSAMGHSGVVAVHELHDRYYTMEVVEGRPLGDFAGADVPRVIDLACELLGILSYIHACGVIHRDLKPDNILVDERDRMVILDFGLALTRARHGEKVAGTIHYMAPELLKGFAVDPRADIYSVGVILYVLCTRRLPFEDEGNLMATMLGQIRSEAPPPRRFNRKLPEALNDLILKAIDKDPLARYQTADALLEDLRMLGGRSDIRRSRIERGARVLVEPAFVGREAELASLAADFERVCERRQVGLTLVDGPGRMGRSRLLTAFAGERLSADELFVEVDFGQDHDGPLGPISTLLTAAVRQLERQQPALSERLNQIFGTLLVSAAPALFQQSQQLRDFGEARVAPWELREALVDYLVMAAEALPVGLLLHRIDLAAKPQVDFFKALVKTSHELPLWLCMALPSSPEPGPWRGLVELSLPSGARSELTLGPLPDEAMSRLLGSMVGMRDGLPEADAKTLLPLCQGRPGLAVELLRDLADDGQVYRQGTRWVLNIEDVTRISRPELLETALRGQLGELAPESRKLLLVLALSENRLPIDVCCDLAELDVDSSADSVRALVRRGFLLERPEAGSRLGAGYVMPYAKLGKHLVDQVSEPVRKDLHRQLAIAMEAHLVGEPAEVAATARHYAAADEPGQALDHYLRAAGAAKQRQQPEVARGALECALELAEQAGDRRHAVEALAQLGSLASRAGDYAGAIKRYREGLERLGSERAARHQVFLRAGLAYAYSKLGKLGEAIKIQRSLVKAASQQPQHYVLLGRLLLEQGEDQKAEDLLRKGMDEARKAGDSRSRGALYHQLGRVQFRRGMFPTAINLYGRAREFLVDKAPFVSAQVALSLGEWQLARGDARAAYKHGEDALYLGEQCGDVGLQVSATLTIATCLELLGDLRKAQRTNQQALRLAQQGNQHLGAADAQLASGRAALRLGEPSQALRLIGRAIKIYKEVDCKDGLAEGYLALGRGLLEEGGDVAKAVVSLSRAEKLFRELNWRWRLPQVYLRVIDSHLAKGDEDAALALLNKSLTRVKSVRDHATATRLFLRYAAWCGRHQRFGQQHEHLVAARATVRRIDDVLLSAQVELDYASYLMDEEARGGRGAARPAERLLSAARASVTNCGNGALVQKLTRALEEARRRRLTGGLEELSSRANLTPQLTQLKQEAQDQLAALRRRFEQHMDESMDGNAILERFEEQLREAEGALRGRIDELERSNQELTGAIEALKEERSTLLTLQELSGKISSTLDSQQLLEMMLDTALELLGAERGFVMLVDEDNEPEFRAARHFEQTQIEDPRSGLSSSIVRKVIRSREPLLTSDATSDSRFDGATSIQELQLKSLMCVPLEAKGAVIGALYVDSQAGTDLFGEADLDLLIAFSNQAALALENALLYEKAREQERLEQELTIAARIQQSLLPEASPIIDGLEVCGRMVPAGQIGGDYFDFIDRDGELAICIGDVSGKGVPAGLVMVMARLILHHLDGAADTLTSILAANRILHGNTEPFVFMSMLLLRWNPADRRLRYTGAGHETLLVYRAGGAGEPAARIESLPAGGVVLGIKPDIAALVEEKELALEEGDLVVLYTDGVTEALDAKGEQYGLDRFKRELAGIVDLSAEEITERLMEDVRQFIGGAAQHDDITITVLRALG